MDTAGKDGLIKHLFTGVNPQGCDVVSFKQPSAEELDHAFLWRCMKRTPERGRIAIFNRSHYEDVLVVRVRPELLQVSKLPDGPRDEAFWSRRYEDLNAFERHLESNGTLVLKFFLNISRNEQRKRLLARLDDPRKQWKFSAADLAERGRWDAYQDAYERAITATSTPWAPWNIVPADHKWVARAVVSAVVARAIAALGLREPRLDEAAIGRLDEARRRSSRSVLDKRRQASAGARSRTPISVIVGIDAGSHGGGYIPHAREAPGTAVSPHRCPTRHRPISSRRRRAPRWRSCSIRSVAARWSSFS